MIKLIVAATVIGFGIGALFGRTTAPAHVMGPFLMNETMVCLDGLEMWQAREIGTAGHMYQCEVRDAPRYHR